MACQVDISCSARARLLTRRCAHKMLDVKLVYEELLEASTSFASSARSFGPRVPAVLGRRKVTCDVEADCQIHISVDPAPLQ